VLGIAPRHGGDLTRRAGLMPRRVRHLDQERSIQLPFVELAQPWQLKPPRRAATLTRRVRLPPRRVNLPELALKRKFPSFAT